MWFLKYMMYNGQLIDSCIRRAVYHTQESNSELIHDDNKKFISHMTTTPWLYLQGKIIILKEYSRFYCILGLRMRL